MSALTLFKCLLLLFVIGMHNLHAQVKVNVNATGSHKNSYNNVMKVKMLHASLRELDIMDLSSDTRKRMAFKIDSADMARDSLDITPDSVPRSTGDSLILYMRLLEDSGEWEELNTVYALFKKPDASSNRTDRAVSVLEKEFASTNYVPDELRTGQQGTDVLSTLTKQSLRRPDTNVPPLPKMETLLNSVSQGELATAQQTITGMKAKYRSLMSSNQPDLGVKKNSLKGLKFKKRLAVRGNIGLKSTDPIIFENNIQLGYQINKRFISGAGVTLREQIGKDEPIKGGGNQLNLSGDCHGYNVFMSYDLIRDFFLLGEFKNIRNRSLFNPNEIRTVHWQFAALFGIGKTIPVSRYFELSAALMYDFNHQHNNLNRKPLVFQVGYRIKKLPFTGKFKGNHNKP